MAKPKMNLIPVAYRITKEQKLKVKLLAKVENDSENGVIRKLIESKRVEEKKTTNYQ